MDTYKPRLRPPENKKSEKENKETVYTREANRLRTQLRPMYFQTGVIPQASGSAYVEIQRTKLICSVWGPRSDPSSAFSDTGRLWCDFKFAPFALEQRRKRGQDPDERQWSMELVNALSVSIQLDKFPKAVLEAHVLVLETDGGVFSAAVTCASLALASAGIELYDLVPACYVAKLGKQIFLDPDESESKRSEGQVMISFMPGLQQVTHTIQDGTADVNSINQMMELALDGCAKMYTLMKTTLITTAKRRLDRSETSPMSGESLIDQTPLKLRNLKIPRLAQ